MKGLVCIFAAQHPKSFADGVTVIIDNAWLSQSNRKNYHHFLDKAPSVYMKKFKRDNISLADTMKTHLIDDMDNFGIWQDDYNVFLKNVFINCRSI